MTWLPASALLLVLAIAVGVVVLLRRRSRRTASPRTAHLPASLSVPTPTDPRVRQFRFTGSNRIVDPKLSAADLRNVAMAAAEQEDFKSENDTIAAFLQDVRDSMGADEALFWRWSEKRDALQPFTWSTPGDAFRHERMERIGAMVGPAAHDELRFGRALRCHAPGYRAGDS
jgi:hypothetical protein